jgi:hypothetical protein
MRTRVWRSLPALCLALVFPALSGCPKGDVGAPCNHGRVEPPESQLVTFPALSCDDLLCVYADETEPPAGSCTVGAGGDQQCNESDITKQRFECVSAGGDSNQGICRLRNQYVLERSMCSKKCGSDADCQSSGVTNQVVVDDTACGSGFKCARIQTLGEFCCEKLCVCEDDLGIGVEDIQRDCAAGTQTGCCDGSVEPLPTACGRP